MIVVSYITSFRGQNYLLPLNITDLFSKDHVCYFIEQITDSLDYSEFNEKYAGAGHPAYHPRIVLKLLMMGSVDGIRSSRRIAKNCQENVVYIYLSEKLGPDFRTISDFRKDNKKLVKNVFLQLSRFGIEHGLIDLNSLFIDGTTIKANANDDKNFSIEVLNKLEKYIDHLIEESIKTDEEEDEIYGERGMHELPKELTENEKRKVVIKKMVEKINQSMKEGKIEEVKQEITELKQKMEKQDIKKYSVTDPESRFMTNKKNKIELSYNAQLVVDKNGLIVSNDVVQDCSDRHQLLPNIAQVEQNFGPLPEGTKVCTDGLYLSTDIMQLKKFDLYIPTYGMQKKEKDRFDKLNFQYNEQNNTYLCPENKILLQTSTSKNKIYGQIKLYECKDCFACPYQKQCCDNKEGHKIITALPHDKIINQITRKLQTPEGKTIYAKREATVEPAVGDIKHNKKFRMFLLRGVEKVKIEFNLACIASNLVKMNNLLKGKTKQNKEIPKILATAC